MASEVTQPDQPMPSMAGDRLDNWTGRYAQRTLGMTASQIRALFSVASRPEVVSLAGGMPYLPALPLDAVADAAGSLLANDGLVALQYGSGQGEPRLREAILEVMAEEAITGASAEDVVVTVGSQQALDLVTRIFCDPGDVVVAEAPSYVGALGVFRAYQADVVHVPMDADGLVPSALEEALTRLRSAGRTVKMLYTIPNYHNPGGVTLALARRAQVLDICRRFGVLVLEDNPYGLLGFDGPPLPALRSMDPDVVYLGSFSKTFAPGLRVGWALAPHAVREKLVLAQESATLCPSSFAQMLVHRYLSTQDWRHQVKVYRELYQERRDATLSALGKYLPQASWNVPSGGFYVWVTLPEQLDAQAMLPRAVTARVAYVPGSAFFGDDDAALGRRCMRLSYCYPPPERITEGVRRLAGVVNAELDLISTFGVGHRDVPAGGPIGPGPELV